MYAKITKDHLFDGDIITDDRTGEIIVSELRERPAKQPILDVRLYDDDGELYYEALADDEALEALYSWAAHDAGVTMLKVKNGNKWEAVIC